MSVVRCVTCRDGHYGCENSRPTTAREWALVAFWNVVDRPAMLLAGVLRMVMLLVCPVTNLRYPYYRWAWAQRWENRLDAIHFDGVSYWLMQRMGKPSGGNGSIPLSRFNAFILDYLDPRA